MLWIDHVAMLVSDLDAAAAALYDRYGLASCAGGRHDGLGTANVIVPLGSAFLELIAVVDAEEAADHPIARTLPALLQNGERLIAWSVAGDEVESIRRRIGLPGTPYTRRLPDGRELRFKTSVSFEAGAQGLPTLVSWDGPPEMHPAATVVPHRVTPLGITCLELGCDEDVLRGWLGDGVDDLPLRLLEGPPGPVALHVSTPQGTCVVDRFLTPEPVL